MDLSQVYKVYYRSLTRYNRALLSRNNLLKNYSPDKLPDMVFPYDAQLAREGAKLAATRAEYVAKLAESAAKIHAHLTSDAEKLEVSYATSVPLGEGAEELYAKKLTANLAKDAQLRFTSFGIHRDDLKLVSNGIDIRAFGSQGQQRTAALSLKLAGIELFREISGEPPVLLLDDVLSELDLGRQRRLLELCSRSQSVVTAAHIDPELLNDLPCTILTVKQGKVYV